MVAGDDLRDGLRQLPGQQHLAAKNGVVVAPLRLLLQVNGVGCQVFPGQSRIGRVAGLNEEQFADVVQQACQEHLGGCATQTERQLARHRCGTRRVVANLLSYPAQILEEGHGGHGHGQIAHIGRTDAHDGLAH